LSNQFLLTIADIGTSQKLITKPRLPVRLPVRSTQTGKYENTKKNILSGQFVFLQSHQSLVSICSSKNREVYI